MFAVDLTIPFWKVLRKIYYSQSLPRFDIVTIAIHGIILIWQKWIKPKRSGKAIYECLFFSPQLKVCQTKTINANKKCALIACNTCSYNRLLFHLNKTEKYLDICQFNLTAREVTLIILVLFKRGVFVRFIADQQMADEASGAKVLRFRKEYIPMKIINASTSMMHNKFIIIDKKIMITGSCNLTKQGVDGNFENLIVTNNEKMVKKFGEYFEYIWENHEEFSKF